MRLIFRKLEMHSFMPFEDEVFEFDKAAGLTLVKGINHDIPDETNGAGKTCMVSGLVYALFGEMQNKVKNEHLVNRYVKDKDMRVSLSFDADDRHYRVARGLAKGKSAYLELYEDERDATKSTIAETQAFLEKEILRCNAATFSRTMFLTSSQTYNFYEMKKSDKKEFVEQLFDIGVFGDMHQAIHRDILDADKRVLAMQNRIMVFRRNESEYAERLSRYDEEKSGRVAAAAEGVEKAKAQLEKARAEYRKVDTSARERLDAARDKLQAALKAVDASRRESESEASRLDLAENKLKQLVESKRAVISKHADLMSKLCGDCRPVFAKYYKLDQYQLEIDDAREKIGKVQAKLSEAKAKSQELSDKRAKIDGKMSEVDGRIRKMSSESAAAGRAVAVAEAALAAAERDRQRAESEANPYVELVESNRKGMADEEAALAKESDSYKYLKAAEAVVSQDTLRKFIISDLIGLLNNKIKTYLTRLGSKYTVEFDSDMNYEFVTNGGKCEFNNFSAGEKMRIMIATSFAFRDFMSIRNGLTSNILVLDEYFDSAISSSCVRHVLDLLEDYAEDGQNVFVISHRSEVDQDVFDRVVTVEKKNDISRIVHSA